MKHPHLNKRHVMVMTRRYLLGAKKRFGSARGLVHYRLLLAQYLCAKQSVYNFTLESAAPRTTKDIEFKEGAD